MANAIAKGAEALVTQRATQSNLARQTAAAARKVGMTYQALLKRRFENAGDSYETTGNVLLDDMLRLEYAFQPNQSDMNAEVVPLADTLCEKGKKPYFISGGGSNTIGALGYAHTAMELVYQADTTGLKIDKIVHATGSASTQAGLLAGIHADQ